MCSTCGCGDGETRITTLATAAVGSRRLDQEHPHDRRHDHDRPPDHEHLHDRHHDHDHSQDHDHLQDHDHSPDHELHTAPLLHAYDETVSAPTQTLRLEQDIMAKNDLAAAHNRGWLSARRIVALNLMSSPGSGKTTLLARTIADLTVRVASRPMVVVEGDQETVLDAERIRATGVPVVQINTGAGCHLDAEMLRRGLVSLDPPTSSLLFIENVGNLVCPALFDLGEAARIVLISVTEGDDKPLKYPHMFAAADLLVINKSDLLPHVDFDVDRCLTYARQLKPGLPAITISATTGEGLETWYAWLDDLTDAEH